MPASRTAARARALSALAAAVALGGCAHRGAAPAASAAAPARRTFEVPGRGGLELTLPPGWIAEASPSAEDGSGSPPPTIRLVAPGGAFQATLTPWWNPGEPEAVAARVDAVQLLVELARRSALAGAVEREIPLEELGGAEARGFWFVSTDRALAGRAPGPGEFRHRLQGAAAVGPLVVGFTLLDQGPGPQRAQLLELVRGARHLPAGEPSPHEGFEVDVGASTVPLAVRLPSRSWSVLVDLPGFVSFAPRGDGEGVLVLAQSPETGVTASVVLRPGGGAADAAGCRDGDLARIRAAARVEELSTSSPAGEVRATYSVPEVHGRPLRMIHAHAWLFRDGVCANVHASKVEPDAEDAARLERILASARFGEEL